MPRAEHGILLLLLPGQGHTHQTVYSPTCCSSEHVQVAISALCVHANEQRVSPQHRSVLKQTAAQRAAYQAVYESLPPDLQKAALLYLRKQQQQQLRQQEQQQQHGSRVGIASVQVAAAAAEPTAARSKSDNLKQKHKKPHKHGHHQHDGDAADSSKAKADGSVHNPSVATLGVPTAAAGPLSMAKDSSSGSTGASNGGGVAGNSGSGSIGSVQQFDAVLRISYEGAAGDSNVAPDSTVAGESSLRELQLCVPKMCALHIHGTQFVSFCMHVLCTLY